MEENRKEQLDKIDELLKDTSAENRVKFNQYNDNTAAKIPDDRDVDIILGGNGYADSEPKPEIVRASSEVEAHSADDDANGNSGSSVCIIDETSTTIELSSEDALYGNGQSASQLYYGNNSQPAKQKKPKEKIKFNALQIVIMSIVGIALLWCIAFTVDHTLASQGLSPIFSWETQKYEDGSVSYKGLGYKVQFRFDSNGDLTQKCVPFWKAGPNDLMEKQDGGVSFE